MSWFGSERPEKDYYKNVLLSAFIFIDCGNVPEEHRFGSLSPLFDFWPFVWLLPPESTNVKECLTELCVVPASAIPISPRTQ